jgi:hypothetical protein
MILGLSSGTFIIFHYQMKKPLTRQARLPAAPAGCERQDSGDPPPPACGRRWRYVAERPASRFG